MRWLRSAPTSTARRLLSPSLSCPLAKGATNDEVLRHWIYHIESTMQYADEKSASEGGEEEGRRARARPPFSLLLTPPPPPPPLSPQPPAPKSWSCST